jgi:hypothetical protein
MKRMISICAVVSCILLLTPAVHAQANQLQPGTQVRLSLLNGLSTTVARDGDPFTAIVAEPVFIGNTLVLPAGARIHGTVSNVTRSKWFGMFRGGASMNLVFSSVEVESRIFPAQMSILSIYNGGTDAGRQRKDIKTVEGAVIEEKHDIKTDITDVGLGLAGGTVVGAIFSNVLRGSVFGLVGGGVYICAKKGKEIDLPAQTGILVRMDSNISVPATLLRSAAYTTESH